jgi:cyclopropane-fatty-acyl-phospholipid synthase
MLDIGCGWGGLVCHAAQHFGVRAHGVTLSQAQHDFAVAKVKRLGLEDRVTIELRDFRELSGEFDKIASIGMFEHVGSSRLGTYFEKLRRLLVPGGLLMNHGITAGGTRNRQLGAGIGDFVERYIFPGGELLHVSRVLEAMADAGWEVLDVENLRPHYARTLWAWSDALESRLDAARAVTPEHLLRAWRLYRAGSAMAFERRWLSLNQVLAARPTGHVDGQSQPASMKGAQSVYPFTRDHVYRSAALHSRDSPQSPD